ncbi:MAG: glycosyltransferase [Nevskia sp.]|nr:glycosyltransferase [Nevskia sp.]
MGFHVESWVDSDLLSNLRPEDDRRQRMRIHYLINGLNGGGAAFPVIDVIKLMRDCGHQVQMLALMPQDRRAIPRLEQAGIDCEIIGDGPGDIFKSGAKLIARLRRDRPDLLWTSLTRATIYGQLAGRLLGIPVVSWQHNAFLKAHNRAILRRSRALTLRWVADSVAVKRFAELELGIAADLVDIWPLFIAHLDVPQVAGWRGNGRFRIGSLGRLHPNKQYDVLIRAAARVRELDAALSQQLEFVVAGAGPERAALDTLAAELGVDNLKFVGFREQPRQFLGELHAYIQPSRNEGLCLAAHEAMQAALPVIATSVGELAHSIVDGETGLLCGVGDVEALAQAILTLVRDPQRAAQMGQAARARVIARFGEDQFSTKGRAILQRIEREISARR